MSTFHEREAEAERLAKEEAKRQEAARPVVSLNIYTPTISLTAEAPVSPKTLEAIEALVKATMKALAEGKL